MRVMDQRKVARFYGSRVFYMRSQRESVQSGDDAQRTRCHNDDWNSV